MHPLRQQRRGYSLVELLVVIAILALLFGLLLSALGKVRETANMTVDKNNLKQIALALNSYSTGWDGQYPSIDGSILHVRSIGYMTLGHMALLLPYIEQEDFLGLFGSLEQYNNGVVVVTYKNPSDPSYAYSAPGKARAHTTSYLANAQVFRGRNGIATVGDGLSHTIGYTERYAVNCGGVQTRFPVFFPGTSRAVFADGGPGSSWSAGFQIHDYPISTNGVTHGSRGRTFLSRPTLDGCDYRVPNTPFSAGLPVAMLDGSVHVLPPSIPETVFWALVTPNGGEVASLDQ